jgi:hypothetical protein
MLLLVIWQVGLGHPWGKQPNDLSVAMRGLWRSYRISLAAVQSVRVVTFDPVKEWGGYGVRTTARGKAFIARGNQAVSSNGF